MAKGNKASEGCGCGCGCIIGLIVIVVVCVVIACLIFPDPPTTPAPTVEELIVERANLQAQYDKYHIELGEDDKAIIKLRSRIESLDTQIAEMQSAEDTLEP